MDHVYRSPEHPSDADLLEQLLARERHPHLATCSACTRRAETLARVIDPRSEAVTEEPFGDLFFRRQAERVRARIAAEDGRAVLRVRLTVPRFAWAGMAVAALIAVAIGLHAPPRWAVVGGPPPTAAVSVARAPTGLRSVQDRVDDRLLRDVDEVFDEDPDDPYDFD